MPRISTQTLRRAFRISPHAATLLPACRDLPSALNELRWIREHVAATSTFNEENSLVKALRVAELCRRRGRGEPLQYVLGTVPFGELEILCRRGVLIPRPEPEAYTTHLAHLLKTHTPPHKHLTILDLCTGTGCIALLLAALLARKIPSLHIQGVDISHRAIQLAHDNLQHNQHHLTTNQPHSPVVFTKLDIFDPSFLWLSIMPPQQQYCDVLISNPPYISPWGFAHQTARSVRKYEPKLAQVPRPDHAAHYDCQPEDVFYARLLDVGEYTRARVLVFEVGDLAQALRVVGMAWAHRELREVWGGRVEVEVWRDWPDAAPREDEETAKVVEVGGERREVRIRGSGHGRSVFIQCGGGLSQCSDAIPPPLGSI